MIECEESVDKVINLKISIAELSKVWQNNVSETTIKNCFKKTGFLKTQIQEEADDDDIMSSNQEWWDELQANGTIEDDILLEAFLSVNVDEDVLVTNYPTDNDILNCAARKNESQYEGIVEDDSDDDVTPRPTRSEVINAFNWAYSPRDTECWRFTCWWDF